MKQFFCSVSGELEKPGCGTAHRKIRSRVQRRVTLRRDLMLRIIISRRWGKNKSGLFTLEETAVGRHNYRLYVHNKAVALCHSTQKDKHRRKDACWSLLDRSRRSGCQEKLGDLVRFRQSLSKWPWHICSFPSLEGGLDCFLRDLPVPRLHFMKGKVWPHGRTPPPSSPSIFAFSACHKIPITISFFFCPSD